MAHAYNPSTLRGQGKQITWGQELGDQPGQHGKTPSLLKIQKKKSQLGVVTDTCNPSYLRSWGRRITWTWGTGDCSESRGHCYWLKVSRFLVSFTKNWTKHTNKTRKEWSNIGTQRILTFWDYNSNFQPYSGLYFANHNWANVNYCYINVLKHWDSLILTSNSLCLSIICLK